MSSVSRKQQRFMGMVRKCQKTGDCSSPEVEKTASTMKPKDAEDFAKTKHKGLPEKVEDKPKKKKHKTFKEWVEEKEKALQEVGTSTSCVASFKAPVFGEPLRTRKKIPQILGGVEQK